MLSVEEYYVVEVHGAEWQYVVQERVILTVKDRVPEDAILSLEMSYPVYYLRRDKFPAELLARSFGASVEQITEAKVIRLDPFEVSSDLPSPTTTDWGTA